MSKITRICAAILLSLSFRLCDLFALFAYRTLDNFGVHIPVVTYLTGLDFVKLFGCLCLLKVFMPVEVAQDARKVPKYLWLGWYFSAMWLLALVLKSGGALIFSRIYGINYAEAAALTLPENEIVTSAPSYITFLSIVLIAPIAEEIVFRHLLLRAWLKTGVTAEVAITIIAVFFGITHFPYPVQNLQMLNQFLLTDFVGLTTVGYLFGKVRLKFSLWHAMICHTSFNALVLLSSDNINANLARFAIFGFPVVIAYALYQKHRARSLRNR